MSEEPRPESADATPQGEPAGPDEPTADQSVVAEGPPDGPTADQSVVAEGPPDGPTADQSVVAEGPPDGPTSEPTLDQPAAPEAPAAPPEWTSPGWSPPGQAPQAATPAPAAQAPPQATLPQYPPAQQQYPQAPQPGYPPQYGQPQQYPQAPQPGYPPQYGQPAQYPQTPQPGYPQAPQPGYPQPGYPAQPPQYGQPAQPPQYGQPAQPGQSPQYVRPPRSGGPTAPGEGWYPQQAHYAPGWQAPVGAPPPSGRRGSRVVLGVIAGIAAVALVVGGVVGGRYWLETRPLGEVTKPMTVHAGRLDTGHCLATLPADGTVRSVRVVPCSDPHVAEVVGARPLPGTSWPGTQQVTTELEKWCEMDTAEQDLGLRPVVWAPSEQGWSQGDRTGLCLAWLPSGTMRGSFTAHDTVTVP